jgi:phosphoribosylglycinamide formyltransferase-1
MESILKSIKKKKIPINPAIVISNKANAKGLKIAEKLGVNIKIIRDDINSSFDLILTSC